MPPEHYISMIADRGGGWGHRHMKFPKPGEKPELKTSAAGEGGKAHEIPQLNGFLEGRGGWGAVFHSKSDLERKAEYYGAEGSKTESQSVKRVWEREHGPQ